jgi:hypothetical protein
LAAKPPVLVTANSGSPKEKVWLPGTRRLRGIERPPLSTPHTQEAEDSVHGFVISPVSELVRAALVPSQ